LSHLGYIVRLHLKKKNDQVPVAHDCNPRYLGGRDQEDSNPRPAQA
jgi:hypothetical protein